MRVSIADLQPDDAVEVDLWGSLFVTVPITRSVQAKMEVLEQQVLDFQRADDETVEQENDRFVALQADLIDCAVKAAAGGRKKASTLVLERWNKDELTLDQLVTFRQRLAAAVRPT